MSACLSDQFPDSDVQSLKLQLFFPHHVIRTSNTFLEVKPLPVGDRRRSQSAEPTGRDLKDDVREAGDFGDVKYNLEHLDNPSKSFVARICSTYLVPQLEKKGVTLMWRQLPIRWDLADLIQVLTMTRTRDVEYVYVPMNHYTNRRVAANRNKRYAFIHFSSAAAAQRFSTIIGTVDVGEKTQMHTSIAKHQGIDANIAFLSTVPDKRRRNMLRANICAFADPDGLDSDGDVVQMTSMSFANLRNGMLSMQHNEASTTDRSTDRPISSVDSDEDLW
jgi:hypothetical protein